MTSDLKSIVFMDHALLLIKAYKNMSRKDFDVAFKDVDCRGEHLWLQYSVTYRCNMLSFFAYLNSVELKAILAYIIDRY